MAGRVMRKYLILIHVFLLSVLFAQDPQFKSIHQLEWEEHLHDSDQQLFYKNTVVSIDPLQERDPNKPQLSHAVFGYLPDWKRNSAPQYFDYSVLSHIALFDFTVSTSGNITGYPAGWPNDWTSMMNTAHANGVKLIMCVVEFDDDDIHTLINSTTASQNFYQNLASIINTYNLDGVNIDFEGPKTEDRGTPMNNFMQGLTNYIKTNVGAEQEISFAGPAVNWSGWNLPGLVNACDYVFIMGYAYWWNGASTTGPSAPITGSSHNLEQTLNNSTDGYGSCDKSKLILGLPYYGNKWAVSSSQKATVGASTLATGSSVFYATARDYYSSYGKYWSTKYEDTWTYYQSGDTWYQAWCNDAEALDAKEKLVFSHGLMGTGMWALGYDEEHEELWNVLRDNFLTVKDTILLDDFEDGLGHFYRNPNYSGSSKGISSESYCDITHEYQYKHAQSLKIVLKDDNESDDDWKIRFLSGSGAPIYNEQIPNERRIHFALLTEQPGLHVSVMIDDHDNELEVSESASVIADGNWHVYSVRLDSADLWTSYSNGNGSIDANFVTLDALLFTAPKQSTDRVVYFDALEAIKINNLVSISNSTLPETFALYQNYPNPFNASTRLNFSIPKESDVRIDIFSISGKHIQTLSNEHYAPGEYSLQWTNNLLPSGIYIASMKINERFFSSIKLTLLK